MTKPLLIIMCSLFGTIFALRADDPVVRVAPTQSVGPRPMEKQTETAVIRDYLKAWRSMSDAFEQNRTDLLDPNFIGTAKEKLANTVGEQAKLGIHTRYRESVHDLKFVFYSPEGLSIQLIDTVEYDVQILDGGKAPLTHRLRARYVAVLTPTEVRWKVRIFQAEPE
jgi:hypothetical protein